MQIDTDTARLYNASSKKGDDIDTCMRPKLQPYHWPVDMAVGGWLLL